MRRTSHRRRASALVVVLWVLGLLSVLVMSFAFDMHVQARLTSALRKRLRAEALAQAGIARAEWLLVRMGQANEAYKGEMGDRWWYPQVERLSLGGAVTLSEELAGGQVSVQITPEPARRGVNQLTEQDWRKVFEVGTVPEERWEDLLACVQDWVDNDDLAHINGAESEDTYLKLETPYRAKNGPLDTVDELLLIKGFTRAVVYGGVEPGQEKDAAVAPMRGFQDLLTVFGDGKVNVNAASRDVLMTIPGMTELVVQDLVAEREGQYLDKGTGKKEDASFKSEADLFARVPDLPATARGVVSTVSRIFRVDVVGSVGDVRRRVSCVVVAQKYGMEIRRWVEEDAL